MKRLNAIVIVLIAAVFLWTSRAELAGIDPVGKVSIEAGAEKEEGTSAGGRGIISILGVVPFSQSFGLQGNASYVGGLGSRFGLSAGPLFSWESGKAGLFLAYQYRTFNSNNFLHLRPSVSFYLPQANINVFYSHPLTDPQRDHNRVEVGINTLQASFNYFPSYDLASFLTRNNMEWTLGLQANSFGGVGSGDLDTGVGPVFGFAFMPTKGLEVNLVKGTIDHHGRYRVQSGVSFYFDKMGATLKDLRRRYLEPNFGGPNSVGGTSEDGRRVCIPRDGVQSLVSIIC
jgi:hypothetical protein